MKTGLKENDGVNDKANALEFKNRAEYRNWLEKHHKTSGGIWLVFTKGSKAFTALDALEESICYGWIDGLIKSIDDDQYRKYFSQRKNLKKWSDKNMTLFRRLTKNGLMTQAGREAYKVEKEENKSTVMDTTEKIEIVRNALKSDCKALALFNEKSPSRQKQFAGFFCEAITEATRNKRKEKIIDALVNGFHGMLY